MVPPRVELFEYCLGNSESAVTDNLDNVTEQLHLLKRYLYELEAYRAAIRNRSLDTHIYLLLAVVLKGCLDDFVKSYGNVGVNASAEDEAHSLGNVGIVVVNIP